MLRYILSQALFEVVRASCTVDCSRDIVRKWVLGRCIFVFLSDTRCKRLLYVLELLLLISMAFYFLVWQIQDVLG